MGRVNWGNTTGWLRTKDTDAKCVRKAPIVWLQPGERVIYPQREPIEVLLERLRLSRVEREQWERDHPIRARVERWLDWLRWQLKSNW